MAMLLVLRRKIDMAYSFLFCFFFTTYVPLAARDGDFHIKWKTDFYLKELFYLFANGGVFSLFAGRSSVVIAIVLNCLSSTFCIA